MARTATKRPPPAPPSANKPYNILPSHDLHAEHPALLRLPEARAVAAALCLPEVRATSPALWRWMASPPDSPLRAARLMDSLGTFLSSIGTTSRNQRAPAPGQRSIILVSSSSMGSLTLDPP
ncbi:hypothetical protein ZWY2020_028090 [Hordeum vulgare]|nr:hypothetical protein ZWY2020_028090 [Hordeum vulgare]